jgi:hypothetical protein
LIEQAPDLPRRITNLFSHVYFFYIHSLRSSLSTGLERDATLATLPRFQLRMQLAEPTRGLTTTHNPLTVALQCSIASVSLTHYGQSRES